MNKLAPQSQYVDDNEMQEILNDEELTKKLKIGFEEAQNGNYTIIKNSKKETTCHSQPKKKTLS